MKFCLKLNFFLMILTLGICANLGAQAQNSTSTTSQPFSFQVPPPKDCPFRDWAEEAAINIMSFDGDTYDAKKAANRKYFTSSGFRSFYQSLEASQIPQMVLDQHLKATTAIIVSPHVTQVEQTATALHYTLEMKLTTTYTNRKKTYTDTYSVTFMVEERIAAPEHWHIEQWIVR